ncbi:hypothetical protein [Lentiprolixibacter aurantiacus]|uniref:Uncharacterized protein n=1 Tax=Lentiprolixibacter aurantiacus TaxID=2993939 RepID=A0AAE3MKM8_9FLAO|nr:hypothetical protein [Lentiprolixibacter aurantiacus]MCX2718958.1 hypothetical protein [Lentiprolixibacter aurantiacus]
MRISLKLFIALIVLFVFTNCSSDDSGAQADPDVESPAPDPGSDPSSTVSIALEGTDNLILENLSSFSSSGSTEINTEGNIDNIADQENIEAPVIFSNDEDEIILGYFPQAITEDQITIADVVYFFVKTYPRLSVRDLDDSILKTSLMESDIYPTLRSQVEKALDQNVSVINDPDFDANVRLFLEELEENNSTSGRDIVAQFKVNYQRNGTIVLPTEAPIFSSFGVQITNQNGTPVYGPKLLTSKELVLSPGSFINFIIKELYEEPTTGTENFTLSQDGSYNIYFTNGKGDTALDELVINQNQRNFVAMVLGHVFPIGAKKWIKNRGCDDILFDVVGDITKFFTDALASSETITTEHVTIFIKDIYARSGEYIVCNTANATIKKYFELIFKMASKRLEIAEDVAELMFQIRDFDGSDIRITETRFFDNDIAYGKLRLTDVTEKVFNQDPGTAFTYEGLVEEEETTYDVDRGALSSQFIPMNEWSEAAEIPFGLDLTGDATIDGNSSIFKTNATGILQLTGIIGNQPSELRLSPVIINIGEIPEEVVVTLNPNPSNERLIAFNSIDEVLVELDLQTGNELGLIATLQGFFSDFVYNTTTNEIFARGPGGTFSINPENGASSLFSDGFEDLLISNSENRLYGIGVELFEINLADGSTSLISSDINAGGYKSALLESTNEIFYRSNGLWKYNLSTNQKVQLSTVGYEGLFVSNAQNRLFAYVSYDKIVELDPISGEEIGDVAILGEEYFTDFVILEQTQEIICRRFPGTFKISLADGTVTEFSSTTYEDLIIID